MKGCGETLETNSEGYLLRSTGYKKTEEFNGYGIWSTEDSCGTVYSVLPTEYEL